MLFCVVDRGLSTGLVGDRRNLRCVEETDYKYDIIFLKIAIVESVDDKLHLFYV